MTILIILVPILFIFPSFWMWIRERRLRYLAKERLNITKAVTKMEHLMLRGDITLGNVSHDILFRHMQRVQYSNRYNVDWKVLRRPDEKVNELAERLRVEMEEDTCHFSKIMNNFMGSYFKAYRLKHPCQSIAYILYLQILKSGLKCAIILLLCILPVIRSTSSFRKKRKEVLGQTKMSFFSQSEAVWQSPS